MDGRGALSFSENILRFHPCGATLIAIHPHAVTAYVRNCDRCNVGDTSPGTANSYWKTAIALIHKR
jgi:hypothetical protein